MLDFGLVCSENAYIQRKLLASAAFLIEKSPLIC